MKACVTVLMQHETKNIQLAKTLYIQNCNIYENIIKKRTQKEVKDDKEDSLLEKDNDDDELISYDTYKFINKNDEESEDDDEDRS